MLQSKFFVNFLTNFQSKCTFDPTETIQVRLIPQKHPKLVTTDVLIGSRILT